MLKHCTAVSVITLAFVVGVMPLINGLIFKYKYYQFVDIINKENRVNIRIIDYHWGWFNSTATIKVSLQDSMTAKNQVLKKFSYLIDEKISHGPIIFHGLQDRINLGYATIHSNIQLAQSIENIKSSEAAQVDSLAEFNGNWHTQINIPALTIILQKIGRINWDGFNADIEFKIKNKRVKHMSIESHFGAFIMNMDSPDNLIKQISIQPITSQSNTLHEKIGLWSGNATIVIPEAAIVQNNGDTVSLNNSNIISEYGVTPDTCYNSTLALTIQTVKIPNEMLPSVTNLSIKTSVNNLRIDQLIDYLLLFVSDTNAVIKNIDATTFEKLFAQTIMPSSNLSADISGKSSLGNFSSQTYIAWPNDAALPSNFDELKAGLEGTSNISGSYNFAFNAIKAYSNNIIPAILSDIKLKKIKSLSSITVALQPTTSPSNTQITPKQLFDEMLYAGYIIEDNGLYSTTLTYEKGVWKMNDWIIYQAPQPAARVTLGQDQADSLQ